MLGKDIHTLVMVPATIKVLRRLDGSDEVGIVPGVDLSATGDILRMWRELMNLRDQWSVRALRHGGSGDHRDVGQGRHLRPGDHVSAKLGNVEVLDDLEKAALMVNEQLTASFGSIIMLFVPLISLFSLVETEVKRLGLLLTHWVYALRRVFLASESRMDKGV